MPRVFKVGPVSHLTYDFYISEKGRDRRREK